MEKYCTAGQTQMQICRMRIACWIHKAKNTHSEYLTLTAFTQQQDGFGGLVVSMLASGTQGRGFKPGRSRWIFTSVKILNMPSSGGEVKESVPCPSFAACGRT